MEPDEFDPEGMFAANMRAVRQQRGWSQHELGTRLVEAGMSLHQSTIARIESGQRPVRLNEAVAMARALGVGLADLLAPMSDSPESRKTALRKEIEDLAAERRAIHDHLGAARAFEQEARLREAELRHALEEAAMSRNEQMRLVSRYQSRLYFIEKELMDRQAQLTETEMRDAERLSNPDRIEKILQQLRDEEAPGSR
ncbi:helix-turn-helix domain-containing protein [Nonomuraea wenchangensis]